jgi:hypothetical protein
MPWSIGRCYHKNETERCPKNETEGVTLVTNFLPELVRHQVILKKYRNRCNKQLRQRDIDAGIIDSSRRLFYCAVCVFPVREHRYRPKTRTDSFLAAISRSISKK